MKKILFTVLFAGMFTFVTNQTIAQDVQFGAKAGISFYSTTFSASAGGFSFEETSDSKLGFALGVYAVVPFHPMFAFQPELMFVQKGGTETDEFFGDEFETKITLNYLDVPLLLRFNVPIQGNVQPYLVAGPTIGFLLSATVSDDDDSEDFSDELSSLNYGLSIGAGVGIDQFNVDLRYEFGLADISDSDNGFGGDVDYSTSGIMLTVGYSF